MMPLKPLIGFLSFTVLLTTAACSSSPTQPSSSASASVAAPRLIQPANAAQIRNVDQPVRLLVQNAVVTQGGGTTYTFEVASDVGFATRVQVKDGIAEGSGGQTAATLDKLNPGQDYYWHVRAQGGGTTGVFGAPYKFTIGAAVVLNPPTPVGPLSGNTSSGWPTFTVTNASKSGPTGAITYRFDIATDAGFNTIILTATVPETANQTRYTPSSTQPAPATRALFWRATAIDQSNAASSAASTTQSFTYGDRTRQAQLALDAGYVLWAGVQPPGTTGHAVMGDNWDTQIITSFDGVTHISPTLDELQIFDLMDRGMTPGAAVAWLGSNGYSTAAVYFSDRQVIGFPFEYMAFIDGKWDLVTRVGG